MKKLVAAMIATAFVAGPVFAQATAPATAPAQEAKKDAAPKDAAKAAPKDAAKAAPKDQAKAAPKDDKQALQKGTQDKFMNPAPAAGSSAARIPPPASESQKMQRAKTLEEKQFAGQEYQRRSGGALHNPPKAPAKKDATPPKTEAMPAETTPKK